MLSKRPVLRHASAWPRLTEKALGRGHKIFINCESAEQLAALDSYLWEFKPTSFVPHETVSNNPDEQVVWDMSKALNRTMMCLSTSHCLRLLLRAV